MKHFQSFLLQRLDELSITRAQLADIMEYKNKSKAFRHIDAWLSGTKLPNSVQVNDLAKAIHLPSEHLLQQIEIEQMQEETARQQAKMEKWNKARNTFHPHIAIYRRVTERCSPSPFVFTDNILQGTIELGDDFLNITMEGMLEQCMHMLDEFCLKNPGNDFSSPDNYFKLHLEFEKDSGICFDRNGCLVEELILDFEISKPINLESVPDNPYKDQHVITNY